MATNGKYSRNKGIRAERELKNLFRVSFPEYKDRFERNQNQSDNGGHDIIGLPGYAPEVKNVADFYINPMWAQTIDQSKRVNDTPVLFRKINLKGWKVYLSLKFINPAEFGFVDESDVSYVVEISYEAFVRIARQRYGLPELGIK